ncbi:hypothetical protein [Candidatus Frankia nodulisporulans]|uniref:hypothetical protein n=1 Tax=Candidatus Frankia nodulisporulans TaxID=2060052 RepID=UPI003704ABC5
MGPSDRRISHLFRPNSHITEEIGTRTILPKPGEGFGASFPHPLLAGFDDGAATDPSADKQALSGLR